MISISFLQCFFVLINVKNIVKILPIFIKKGLKYTKYIQNIVKNSQKCNIVAQQCTFFNIYTIFYIR